jgi:hypothetical protein
MQKTFRFLLHFFELCLAESEVKLKYESKTGFYFSVEDAPNFQGPDLIRRRFSGGPDI